MLQNIKSIHKIVVFLYSNNKKLKLKLLEIYNLNMHQSKSDINVHNVGCKGESYKQIKSLI